MENKDEDIKEEKKKDERTVIIMTIAGVIAVGLAITAMILDLIALRNLNTAVKSMNECYEKYFQIEESVITIEQEEDEM